jgi:hypothetical protein
MIFWWAMIFGRWTPSGLTACYAIPQILHKNMIENVNVNHGFGGGSDKDLVIFGDSARESSSIEATKSLLTTR